MIVWHSSAITSPKGILKVSYLRECSLGLCSPDATFWIGIRDRIQRFVLKTVESTKFLSTTPSLRRPISQGARVLVHFVRGSPEAPYSDRLCTPLLQRLEAWSSPLVTTLARSYCHDSQAVAEFPSTE